MRYKALVFDFFGVLCSEIAPFWLARHMPADQARRVKQDIVGAADRGEISQGELFERLSQISGVPPAQVESEWFSLAVVDSQMVALASTLKSTLKLGLLTNSPAAFVRHILRSHQLAELFDSVVVSSEVKAAKPDPAIYHATLHELAVRPEEVLFVDDNSSNVEGAERLGIRALVFESHDALVPWLVACGVITPPTSEDRG